VLAGLAQGPADPVWEGDDCVSRMVVLPMVVAEEGLRRDEADTA
jgi:hypothetical protein